MGQNECTSLPAPPTHTDSWHVLSGVQLSRLMEGVTAVTYATGNDGYRVA